MVTSVQLNDPAFADLEKMQNYSLIGSAPVLEARSEPEGVMTSKILRFAKSERMLHWSIAGPFLVSFATGIMLVLIYNPDPSRPWRYVFATLHRASGAALSVLPILALIKGRRDFRIHLYNVQQAWTWIYDDFRWLALMGLAALSSRFRLPEQGKFNAAEKLNFMVLMGTYPFYIMTGFLMWLAPLPVLSWIVHCTMAALAMPLILGHLYMALINKDTHPALEGMISGHVDRQWAKHHYRRWYRTHHETTEKQVSGETPLISPASQIGFLITRAGSPGCCELAPGLFIRSYKNIRENGEVPAFGELINVPDYRNWQPARAAGGISPTTGKFPQVLNVKVGDCVLLPSVATLFRLHLRSCGPLRTSPEASMNPGRMLRDIGICGARTADSGSGFLLNSKDLLVARHLFITPRSA